MVDRTNEQEYASKLRPVSVMLQRGLQSQQPISG
jgi:hypothetical protein